MSAILAASELSTIERLPLGDLARMMREAIRDRSYQRETRLGSAVAKYLAWKRLSASARTLVIYEGYLARLCLSLADIDPAVDEVTDEMLLQALSEYERGSLKLVRTTYSDFFRWAQMWDYCAKNPVEKLPKIHEPSTKVYDVFTTAEQALLIKATESMPLPWLQRLRALCFIDLGIRKDEARGLQPADFDTTSKVVVVKGKGEKERVVPIGEDTWRAFIAYRNRPIPNVRMQDERGKYREDRPPLDTDYIFFPYGFNKRTGAVTWADPFRKMSERGLHSWWADYLIPAAGVRYRSMHMARHTVGTELATGGADSFSIRDWLGHADVSTTQVYVHNSKTRLKNARRALDEYRKAQEG